MDLQLSGKWIMKQPPKVKYALLALAVLALTGAVVWKYVTGKAVAAENIPAVKTMMVTEQADAQGYSYSGEVRGRFESQLAFQVNGKIVRRNVELGSVVQPGDILMQIDAKDIQQTVNSASAQVNSAQSQLRLAESNLKRYRQLLEQGAISRAQYDQYTSAYEVAAAGVDQASAQHVQGANQLDYTFLKADKPGVVAAISAEMGQVVAAGQTVVTVVQDGEREVEISVPENRIEELRKAKQLKVSFWALPGVALDGVVREIAPMADATTRTFKVRVTILQVPESVRLGMTATVTMPVRNGSSAVMVPLSAIYQNGEQPCVWVVKNDSVVLCPVQLGPLGNGSVQVVGGLQYGDRVVTAGVHKLREGLKVKVGGETL